LVAHFVYICLTFGNSVPESVANLAFRSYTVGTIRVIIGVALNVLMLGWEFPPFNSGGLGTACLGLTEGLSNRDITIDFVLPHVPGTFEHDHLRIIDAAAHGDQAAIATLIKEYQVTDIVAFTNVLAYGATLTIEEQTQLVVDYVQRKSGPVPPNVQAHLYAQNAAVVAANNPNFDVIHSHDWFTYHAGIAARQVAAENGRMIPFVAHIHATEYDRCGENGDPSIIAIEREGLNAADRVVAVSEYTKQIVHKRYGVPLNKISVVYNGIPAHKKPHRFDIAKLKEHHKIVLFIGRVTMQKGPEYFVQVAKAVTDIDPSVRFIMVGSGDMEKRMIEYSASLGLTGKVLFSSFLRGKDVDRAYQLADLFVMPSVSEPFGIVALEAMQNGTPTLVSNQSGVAEVSQNILKVDFWDIPAMRDAVLSVVHNDGHAESLRAAGHADLQNLTWDHAAAKMHEVYDEVCAEFAALPTAHLSLAA
jgi:glycosyltransferase involved in cell wall biosynthesis